METLSGSGRPLGLAKCEPVMPSSAAVAFISATKAGSEPLTPSASTTAMSLADFTSIILRALSTVTCVPTRKPILEGFCAAAFSDTATSVCGVRRPLRSALKVT